MNFADLGLSDELLQAVEAAGYTTPTPIQEQAIPQIREHFGQFGSDLPASLTVALDTLDARLR